MSLFIVDVESDGPAPGLYSMVSLGCVRVDRELKTTFKATFAPISDRWIPEALAISQITRGQHLAYPDPAIGMAAFGDFLKAASQGRPIFVSDNPAFDWQWVNYYFHRYLAETRSASRRGASATSMPRSRGTSPPPMSGRRCGGRNIRTIRSTMRWAMPKP